MCGLKEIFEGAGNFFDKKVPANPTFHLEKIKFNPFRFAMPPSLSGTALKRRFLGSHERGAVTQ